MPARMIYNPWPVHFTLIEESERRGVTRKQLATMLAVPVRQPGRWASGVKPSIKVEDRIMALLDSWGVVYDIPLDRQKRWSRPFVAEEDNHR